MDKNADVKKFQKACFEVNYSRGSLKVAIARRAYKDDRYSRE